jgi:hypothetical protein
MESAAIDRRRLFDRTIKGILGLAGSYFAFMATKPFWADAAPGIQVLGDIPKVLGEDRLRSDVQDQIKSYVAAEAGEVMAYNQLFWSYGLAPEVLWELPTLVTGFDCPSRKNRLRAFPAIACIHALPALSKDDWL